MSAPIIKGLLLGLILSISIGPVIFAILKQSLTNGHKAGYAFVAGVSLSDMSILLDFSGLKFTFFEFNFTDM
jgi:threonine/homoserine/homoserine lactone efflux protein